MHSRGPVHTPRNTIKSTAGETVTLTVSVNRPVYYNPLASLDVNRSKIQMRT